ncbi:leucine-rich repeat, immunoglobulin-like domain and transmembrane domain-containing protein 3b [Alosa pseudoharengus]|uniref:leucine-rich repeat, immunoglobulin-like domain and transmembrane domain-containing protein 3b n=1 Tax=Alosa pseudoharengus TaxID=34774 RepID=UPI003F8B28D2
MCKIDVISNVQHVLTLIYSKKNVCVCVCVCVSPACPSLCSCMYQGGSNDTRLRFVECRDPAIVMVPADLPPDTFKLRLQKTSVVRVPKASFSSLAQLRYLWLTYNSITTLHPRSFANLSALHELRLDGNLLSVFPWDALKDMPRLRTLGLHNNRLTRIPVHAARFLGNITYLDLSSNRLTTLANEVIAALPFYPPFNPAQPQSRVVLGLQDNLWVCDCRLALLLELSKATESYLVLLDRYLMCSGPKEFSGVPFQSVELPRCLKPSVLTSTTKIITPLGGNVMVRCEATGFPTPVLIWIKAAGSNISNTVFQNSPQVGIRWSVISLSGISYRDAGEYRCRAHNMAGSSEASISLDVVGVITKTSALRMPAQKLSNESPPTLQRGPSALDSVSRRYMNSPKTSRNTMKRDQMKRNKMKRDKMSARLIK